MTEITSFKLGGVDVKRADEASARIALLLWGDPGIGKTTLAMTAPGKKLHMCFDPDGFQSIRHRDDVDVADLSQISATMVQQFKKDPFGISKHLDKYDTFVIDSLTAVSEKTLAYGIESVKGATLERPSPGAYGTRNAYLIELVRSMLEITGRAKKHVIFTAHEDAAVTDNEGNILEIPMSLGGKLPGALGHRINEIWWMSQGSNGVKRIAIGPARNRKPMKTRMWKTSGGIEFPWKFNADTNEGEGIAEWFERWKSNNYEKIEVPK